MVLMQPYEGTSSIEAFLNRFEDLRFLHRWTDVESKVQLRHAMRGPAEHIVSELHFDLSVPAMVALIKRRFGRADQQERYRSELQRLRQGKLTLEQLHYQVRELAHRAYPTAPASVVYIIARDAYVQALDNAEMRLRMRTAVPVPETLEDVVRVTGQLEVWLAPAARDDSQRRPERVRQVVAGEARDAHPRAHPRRRSMGRSPRRFPHKDPVLEAVKQQLSQLKTELESRFQALGARIKDSRQKLLYPTTRQTLLVGQLETQVSLLLRLIMVPMLIKSLVESLAVVATAGRKVIGGRSAPTHVVAPFHPRNGRRTLE